MRRTGGRYRAGGHLVGGVPRCGLIKIPELLGRAQATRRWPPQLSLAPQHPQTARGRAPTMAPKSRPRVSARLGLVRAQRQLG